MRDRDRRKRQGNDGVIVRINWVLAAAASLVLTTAGAADATTVALDGSYTIAYTGSGGNGPTISDKLSDPFALNLTVGVQTANVNFITATPAGTCGTGCTNSTASGTIKATFTFTSPTGATGNLIETGTYQAKYSGAALACTTSPAGQTDCIDWSTANDPLAVTFSNGDVLYVTLYNAQDWAITPQISFKLVDPVPLPAALPLFASGLSAVGFIGLRRKRKAAAIAS